MVWLASEDEYWKEDKKMGDGREIKYGWPFIFYWPLILFTFLDFSLLSVTELVFCFKGACHE